MAKRKKPQSCKSGFAWDVDMKKCVPEGQAKKPPRQPPGGRKSATGDLTKAGKTLLDYLTFGASSLATEAMDARKAKKKKKPRLSPKGRPLRAKKK